MLKSPPPVQKQLSTAIAIIGKEDFPLKWPNLINDMVSYHFRNLDTITVSYDLMVDIS